MDLEKLEQDIRSIISDIDEGSFIYELLIAYGQPKSSIARLKRGDYNQSRNPGEVLWKKRLFFRSAPTKSEAELFHLIDSLSNDAAIRKHHPRFIIVTNYQAFLAVDTKTADSLDTSIAELPRRANFFLPWAGMEKSAITSENPADIKAAEKMGQLYDLLLQKNEIESEESRHALNVFLSRLLFCFFAEDTDIFEDDQFTKGVDSHTAEDGGDLAVYLKRLFELLNAKDRADYPEYLQALPYVNGGLFADDLPVPAFSRKSRKMLIECGALNWEAINPDIFGSMMQAVTLGEERSNIGMHYTSVVNIMKVIEPLFLNDLNEELEKANGNEKKLEKLLSRLYHLRIFDPACGSGNFLIISYKELCRLEIEIFQQLQEMNPGKWSVARSGIQLNQFFGIEIDDFAAETAKLSLWLAEHQMNLAFVEVFGNARPTLPLKESGKILCGNAIRLDWEKLFVDPNEEYYLLGNPPYLGFNNQSAAQKDDLLAVFSSYINVSKLDYVSCWLKKASDFIRKRNGVFAFVSTSSICQGEQVSLLWPILFSMDMEIFFAHTSFPWSNNARDKAAVMCVIVGVRNKTNKTNKTNKVLIDGSVKREVSRINAYLVDGENITVSPHSKPISDRPIMTMGSNAIDGKNLIVTKSEFDSAVLGYEGSRRFFKRFMGGADFLNDKERYCIWIDDKDVDVAGKIEFISDRMNKCRAYRLSAGRDAKKVADKPHRFCYRTHKDSQAIFIPQTTSSRREYLPIGFTDGGTVISAKGFAIYEIETYIFGLLSSKLHNVWLASTSGRTSAGGYAYSVKLTYNTFPIPAISENKKSIIEKHVFQVLEEREAHSEKTLAELYDPDKMPDGLRTAHRQLDLVIEQCYRIQSFKSDSERFWNFYLSSISKWSKEKANKRIKYAQPC